MRKEKEILVRVIKEVSDYQDIAHFTDNHITFNTIVELVFDATGWTHKDTYLKSRKLECVFRRGIIDLIATCNNVLIAECAKNTWRDHTTVLHSLQSIEQRLDSDMYARKSLREIMSYIRENYKEGA